MSRVYSNEDDQTKPSISQKYVDEFFVQRAKKISSVGPLQAVIYQDKNPLLAERRNVAEKAKLLPLLNLDGSQRVLDVGCGTGRWASEIIPNCLWYHGIDACRELVEYSVSQYSSSSNCKFSVASADSFSLDSIFEDTSFDRILCAGLLIYLNDNQVHNAIKNMLEVLKPGGVMLIREPMGLGQRLTIREHFSEEMDQNYSAIYRTADELERIIRNVDVGASLDIIDSGDLFEDSALNNRSDTKQRWILLERSK